jgi:hypothetical protein
MNIAASNTVTLNETKTETTSASHATVQAKTSAAPSIENYNPAALLDFLLATMRLANDRALAVKMNMRPSLVAKLREGRIAVSGSILMWMQQASGLTIQQLRTVLGDQRTKLRFNG